MSTNIKMPTTKEVKKGTVMHPWGFLRGWSFDLSGKGFTTDKLTAIEKHYKEILI
jgi:hypothetical protein